ITNGDTVPLEMVDVALEISTLDNLPADDLWFVPAPVLTGISDIQGGGVITPGMSAKIVWTLLPTHDAAPTAATLYRIGGHFSYVTNGVPVSVPVLPETVTVKPDPSLVVQYFWQRDVFSDDPFTPEIEPSEPFTLGMFMTNKGFGAARNVRITTGQPEIVE